MNAILLLKVGAK